MLYFFCTKEKCSFYYVFNKKGGEMMSRFKKVSSEQFTKDMINLGYNSDKNSQELAQIYEEVKLPTRSTQGAAGYDFYSPIGVTLEPENAVILPSGVSWIGDKNTFLSIVPRSGLGFKYQLGLSNTIGIVDADFCLSDNEGHIMISLKNCSDIAVTLMCGERIAQGIFLKYLKVDDDSNQNARLGGFGSTN